eukprot:CAMPEP_0170738508 /NCGR_PEP_ID=MMETSP0437-20130122/4682_1 /TAXON_ID=0 /ORGANISM="Sexangularia sp." /LENGTH=352 /DNA_ID=CAMNT_0011076935 /DNA_START=57 /DNA_END=1112 /DNA_ORIENTATION=-
MSDDGFTLSLSTPVEEPGHISIIKTNTDDTIGIKTNTGDPSTVKTNTGVLDTSEVNVDEAFATCIGPIDGLGDDARGDVRHGSMALLLRLAGAVTTMLRNGTVLPDAATPAGIAFLQQCTREMNRTAGSDGQHGDEEAAPSRLPSLDEVTRAASVQRDRTAAALPSLVDADALLALDARLAAAEAAVASTSTLAKAMERVQAVSATLDTDGAALAVVEEAATRVTAALADATKAREAWASVGESSLGVDELRVRAAYEARVDSLFEATAHLDELVATRLPPLARRLHALSSLQAAAGKVADTIEAAAADAAAARKIAEQNAETYRRLLDEVRAMRADMRKDGEEKEKKEEKK